jgi:hypothetical protein
MSCSRVVIRKSELSDILPIAEKMRKCDRDEVWASHGHTPLQALQAGYKDELGECYTVLLERIPIAMMGISKTPFDEMAGVWFLGTDAVYKAKSAFYTEAPKFLAMWHKTYRTLFNIVDLRNEVSIHWMVQMGFEVHDINFFKDTHERRPFALMMRYA